MKGSELRIGNYLLKDGIVVKIDGRSIFDIWSAEISLSLSHRYDGIPLTERWLDSLGFRKIAPKNWFHPEVMGFDLKNTSEHEKGFKIHAMRGVFKLSNQIETVHMLQNVWYAFTNYELHRRVNEN